MGLQEKQAWAAENPKIKAVETQLTEIIGKPVTLWVDEASFATKASIETISWYVLPQIAPGFEDLCSDGLAKEAVQGAVNRIEITQTSQENFAFEFKGGTLKVTANFDGTGMCGIQYPHANDYKDFLTKNL